ncbi:GNAT family N-acetyltransferase [Arthrobacter sp. zg-Y820]|uniref:GNAT family N-acetyltransferase n=1 Tax=unclassified Arthrobacter TaxID=235627 RepID=UPI0025408CB8|nr:GNAT family N-acetyltransferase [Arthrobacter sp. zg.Y820]MCC9197553.1 GNAT family N-acetyltransferase [Arthrobacter sp. zg-Y820]MDK1280420.1 GNAT family N-acetyltransferase [Arthrobacter sp. zg.Y820]
MTITPDHTAPAAEPPAPATGFRTERLQLDPLSPAELDALIIQSRLSDWAPDFPQPTDHDAAQQFFETGLNISGALTTRLIREQATAQVIGTIGFLLLPEEGDAEVSYSVVPSRRGQGYATEALIAMARRALEQENVSRVVAYTEVENESSQSLLLTAGFLPVETPGLGLGFALSAAQLPELSL